METLPKNTFEENRKSIRRYIKNIIKSKEYGDGHKFDDGEYNIYDFWIKYLIIIHNSLLMEEKFQNEFKISGKEINKHLKLLNTTDFNKMIKLSQNYYDSNSKVRFGIETMDSIEEVRIYVNKLIDSDVNFYDKIYFSF